MNTFQKCGKIFNIRLRKDYLKDIDMPVCCLNLWIGLDWNGLFHIDKIVKKRNNDDNNDNNNSDK